MKTQEQLYVKTIKRHFDPVLKMLEQVGDLCPDELWNKVGQDVPCWHHMYHAAFFVDYWIREVYSKDVEYRSAKFSKDIAVELDKRTDDYLTKEELADYLRKIQEKTDRFFDHLTDAKLLEEIVPQSKHTYLDAIMSQIRHVQYHVACCNALLKQANVGTVKWVAYNEK